MRVWMAHGMLYAMCTCITCSTRSVGIRDENDKNY